MKRRFWTLAITRASLLTIAATLVTFETAGLVVHLQPGQGTWQNPGPWVDWQTYANAFERMLHGASIYAPEQLSGPYRLSHVVLIGYAYPPASVPLFAPFLQYPFGLAAWLTCNIGLMLTSMWALITRAWPSHRSVIFAAALGGLAFFTPFTDGVVSGNVSVAMAGMVGWAAVGLQPSSAGIYGALGAVTKVFSAPIALATPVDKLRGAQVGILLTMAIALVTLPVVGLHAWPDFVRSLAGADPDCSGYTSVACLLAPSVGVTVGTWAGFMVGGLAVVGLVIVRQPFWLACLASVAFIAPATNLWPHYWNAVYVLLIAGLATLAQGSRDAQVRPDGASDLAFATGSGK